MHLDEVTNIRIDSGVIPTTATFLQERGMLGCEGRVYWIGELQGQIPRVTRVVVPEQIARRTLLGVSVTVPQHANVQVARELKPFEYIVAKVHSHPREAYNSDTDKANPFLRHPGAISIIVPNFGHSGMDRLQNCAVCRFRNGDWVDLSKQEVQQFFSFM